MREAACSLMTSAICRLMSAALVVLATCIGAPVVRAGDTPPPPGYAYEDTRRLVSLVERAAQLVEQKGRDAFGAFGNQPSLWVDRDFYLFVYALDGTCLYHGAEPDLVGHNLMDMRDLSGKPVIRLITDIGRQTNPQASGWVFYLWEDGIRIEPSRKAAFVRKAISGPDGQIYLVGSGAYALKMERAIVQHTVQDAAQLISEKGTAAFAELLDAASRFALPDAYIFVMDEQGNMVVDPAYPRLPGGRDLTKLRDATGVYVVRTVLEKLAGVEEAWVQFLLPRPGLHVPVRKAIYVRKVRTGDKIFLVGADFFLATPIWMKV